MQAAFDYKDWNEYLRIAQLMAGFVQHSLTEAEHDELDRWVNASEANLLVFEELTALENLDTVQRWFHRIENEAVQKATVRRRIKKECRRPARQRRMFYLAAASLLAAVAVFGWLQNKEHTSARQYLPTAVQGAPAHPTAKPFLILHNGDTVLLQNNNSGTLAVQGNNRIEQSGNGLRYEANGNDDPAAPDAYNVLTTPVGMQFSLTLSDGTRVWLNAASSLRYPVRFGSTRTVELQGEGYFEVAHNAARPFKVLAGGTTVQVLGTHFNIDAYGDEGKIRTTLLEGSVQVSDAGKSETIRPGQQAVSGGGTIKVGDADTEAATAWKEGVFLFRNTTAPVLLAQISRWYGVQVVYRAHPAGHFHAAAPRSETLEHLLQVLEKTGNLHTARQGNQLIVQP